MEKCDLRYLAKIVRRYCRDKNYVNAIITPDYGTGHIEVTGLPVTVKVLEVCKIIEEKGVKVIGRGDTKVLIRF